MNLSIQQQRRRRSASTTTVESLLFDAGTPDTQRRVSAPMMPWTPRSRTQCARCQRSPLLIEYQYSLRSHSERSSERSLIQPAPSDNQDSARADCQGTQFTVNDKPRSTTSVGRVASQPYAEAPPHAQGPAPTDPPTTQPAAHVTLARSLPSAPSLFLVSRLAVTFNARIDE